MSRVPIFGATLYRSVVSGVMHWNDRYARNVYHSAREASNRCARSLWYILCVCV